MKLLTTALLVAVPTLATAQNVGLVATWSPAPQVGQSVGQPCGPVVCPTNTTQPLTPSTGAPVRLTVFGAANRLYALAASPTLGCQNFGGIQYPLSLGGAPATLAVGILPPPSTGFLCGGRVEEATTTVTIPAALPPGSSFVLQALTFENLGNGAVQPAFTNAVRLVVN